MILTTNGYKLFCNLIGSLLAGYQLISQYRENTIWRNMNYQSFANEKTVRYSLFNWSKNALKNSLVIRLANNFLIFKLFFLLI
jgi:hypothetical protein